MIGAVLFNQRRILPCAVYLQDEYGIDDLFVGVPVKLGSGGIKEIVELDLQDNELADFKSSNDAVR
ncbi:MAG: hypothetical protein H0U04_09690 [Rubrobacter sp.]|nr:hypothetical protein [Rubrobacter sp.]